MSDPLPAREGLATVLDLAAKATPGPWRYVPEGLDAGAVLAGEPVAYTGLDGGQHLRYPHVVCDDEPYYPHAVATEDMEAIAAAVNWVRDHGAALLARVAELEAANDRYHIAMNTRCVDEWHERLAAAEQVARECEPYRDATFDGNAVYAALTDHAKRRTGPENVADTLDALHRIAKAPHHGAAE